MFTPISYVLAPCKRFLRGFLLKIVNWKFLGNYSSNKAVRRNPKLILIAYKKMFIVWNWCPDNCPRGKLPPPVRAKVWFRVRVRGEFFSEAIVLESSKELLQSFYLIIDTYIHFIIPMRKLSYSFIYYLTTYDFSFYQLNHWF